MSGLVSSTPSYADIPNLEGATFTCTKDNDKIEARIQSKLSGGRYTGEIIRNGTLIDRSDLDPGHRDMIAAGGTPSAIVIGSLLTMALAGAEVAGAIVVILSNLAVDMLYGFLDPRVRYG